MQSTQTSPHGKMRPKQLNTLTLYTSLRARQRSRGTLTRYAQVRAVHARGPVQPCITAQCALPSYP